MLSLLYSVFIVIKMYMIYVFFFKQKTAYEMRISDWSSDVCTSDLHRLISELARGEAGISQAVDLLETAFPAGQVRAARHAVLLAAARSARHLNDKSWSYLLRHFAAIGSELGQIGRAHV